MSTFPSREEAFARLATPCDVLVIGGGATGLGIALDAATRGYRTLLVEARDVASGTSSRSTKLIHGGVRYLQRGDLPLVREALRERERLLRNAPHVVHPLRFLVPAYRRWERPYYGAGLALYDRLAGASTLPRSRLVDAAAAARLVPSIARDGLRGGVTYADAQFDDARLALLLARTAAAHGATLLTHAPVVALLHAGGRVAGAVVEDAETGERFEVHARATINATGVFSDALRRLDEPDAPPLIAPSRGTHLVLDHAFLPGETALLIPRSEDGRVVFVIPWLGRTLVGTTDVPVDAASQEPRASDDEIDFLLRAAARELDRPPTRADVRAIFSGLRPLVRAGDGRATAKLARDHRVVVSASGLVTIGGGKWTTWRRMAEDALDRAAATAGLPARPCRTATLPLAAGDARDPGWRALGASEADAVAYTRRYPGALHPRLPYALAMAAWTIDHEQPRRLDDVLARRLRALALDEAATIEAAPAVSALLAARLGRDAAWEAQELVRLLELTNTTATTARATPPG